jgi:hypothetical protein
LPSAWLFDPAILPRTTAYLGSLPEVVGNSLFLMTRDLVFSPDEAFCTGDQFEVSWLAGET